MPAACSQGIVVPGSPATSVNSRALVSPMPRFRSRPWAVKSARRARRTDGGDGFVSLVAPMNVATSKGFVQPTVCHAVTVLQ